ncbi:MAG: hypothetical protein V1735_01865 [Nanoarchaeota archaeon]
MADSLSAVRDSVLEIAADHDGKPGVSAIDFVAFAHDIGKDGYLRDIIVRRKNAEAQPELVGTFYQSNPSDTLIPGENHSLVELPIGEEVRTYLQSHTPPVNPPIK